MPTLTFDEVNRVITVGGDPLPTEVTIQELINAIRDWEDNLENMDNAKVADASGKEALGGNLQVGITLKLLNWRVKFTDRPPPNFVVCTISGGNLVAVDASNQPMSPIAPASYVTTTLATAVSAALVAEWTQAEKEVVLVATPAIRAKTDNLPADPASQSVLLDDHTVLKEPAGHGYDREEDSLKKLSDKIDQLGKQGTVFSV